MIKVPATGLFPKKTLLAYLPQSYTLPIDHPNFFGHSNFQECRALIQCLIEQGYACDVVDWQADINHLAGLDYDLVIALHHPLAYARSLVHKTGKVVLYATTAHWLFHNMAEQSRLLQLRNRKGAVLLPRRQLPPILFEDQIDEIWHLGNDFQKMTYAHLHVPTYRIPISTVEVLHASIEITDENKKNFLWYASTGAVHKGLDWLLEIFSRAPHLTLHICGLVELEPDFLKCYQTALFNLPNVHFHGWVLPHTDRYNEICQQCAFIVAPSASEGGGGALLQCMKMGLVPIGTPGCSVDLIEVGFKINVDTLEETEKTLHAVAALPLEVLTTKSKKASQRVKAEHSLAAYKNAIAARL